MDSPLPPSGSAGSGGRGDCCDAWSRPPPGRPPPRRRPRDVRVASTGSGVRGYLRLDAVASLACRARIFLRVVLFLEIGHVHPRVRHLVHGSTAVAHPYVRVGIGLVGRGVVVPRLDLDDRALRQQRRGVVGIDVGAVPLEAELGTWLITTLWPSGASPPASSPCRAGACVAGSFRCGRLAQ